MSSSQDSEAEAGRDGAGDEVALRDGHWCPLLTRELAQRNAPACWCCEVHVFTSATVCQQLHLWWPCQLCAVLWRRVPVPHLQLRASVAFSPHMHLSAVQQAAWKLVAAPHDRAAGPSKPSPLRAGSPTKNHCSCLENHRSQPPYGPTPPSLPHSRSSPAHCSPS